jgi:hypothetical protein
MFREELRLRLQGRRIRLVKSGGKLMETKSSSGTSGFLRNTRRRNPEDGIFEEIFVFLAASRRALPFTEPQV